MPRRFKPLHPPLSLSRWLMRVLGAVVQVPGLAVLHSRQDLLLRGPITFQFVRDEHPRHAGQPFEKLTEKLLRGLRVAAALHQNIQHMAVLVDRPPEIMALTVDR